MMRRIVAEGDLNTKQAQQLAVAAFKELLSTVRDYSPAAQEKFYAQIILDYQAKLQNQTVEDLTIAMNNLAVLMSEAAIINTYPQIGKAAETLVQEINEKINSMTINLNALVSDYSNANNDHIEINHTPQAINSNSRFNFSSSSKLFPWTNPFTRKNHQVTSNNQSGQSSSPVFDK